MADGWLARWPESIDLRLWTVTNWARSGRADEALAVAETLVADHPEDVRSHVAHAFALRYAEDSTDDALAAADRALELGPTDPLAVWIKGFVLFARGDYDEIAVLMDERLPELEPWAELVVVKANAVAAQRYDDEGGDEKFAEGLALFAEARAMDPENLDAHFFPASYLAGARRLTEALPLLDRALEISPLAPGIHQTLWQATALRRDLEPEEKRALVAADAEQLLAARGDDPATLLALTNAFEQAELQDRKRAVEDRILAEHPGSEQAEWVLINRARDLRRQLAEGEITDTAAYEAELRRRYWDLLDRKPWAMEDVVPSEAYRALFMSYSRDEEVDPDTLVMLAEGMAEYERLNPSMQATVALALADRGVGLDVADRIARDGIDLTEDYLEERRKVYEARGQFDEVRNWLLAGMHDAVGWVAWKQGDRARAIEHLETALELNEKAAIASYHLGRIAEAEGDLDAAQRYYAQGRAADVRLGSDRKSDKALAALYESRYGTTEGYEEWADALTSDDVNARRSEVLADRIEDPQPAPTFRLVTLTGDTVTNEVLDGKVGVINFWGTWCGPCVAEAPQLQEFHEKYADHPDVVFLTIDNDPDPDDVRVWVERHEVTYPVLLDDGFVSEAGVHAFPTTWFIDRDGRLVYSHEGATAVVLEEFTWRVEALLAEGTPR